MSKSRHQRSIDVEQRQQEQPLLVDAQTGSGCLIAEEDEMKPIDVVDRCLERAVGVDGLSAVPPGTIAQSTVDGRAVLSGVGGAFGSTGIRRPSLRGTNVTSSSSSWKLKYQDFMPSQTNVSMWDKSEHFQKLVDRANDWLRRNGTDVLVKTCETVTWMGPEPRILGDPELMVQSKSFVEGTETYYVRGLRLWLVPRPGLQSAASSRHGKSGASNQSSTGHATIYCTDFMPETPDCTRIPDLVNRLNRKLEQRQLKGRILTIETISVPAVFLPPPTSPPVSGHGKSSLLAVPVQTSSNGGSSSLQSVPGQMQVLNSQVTRWSESVDVDWPRAFGLRVFTVRDPAASLALSSGPNRSNNGPGGRGRNARNRRYQHQQLYGCDKVAVGIKDVVPRPSVDGYYEGYEVLIDRTNTWLKDQTDIYITNLQSVLVQKVDGGPHMDMGSACFHTMPGLNNDEPAEFFRILRVAYVRPIGENIAVEMPVIYPFTYESFTPELVRHKDNQQLQGAAGAAAAAVATSPSGGAIVAAVNGTGRSGAERMEKMKETFSKVIAFLRNSGSQVICSETVLNPVLMYSDENTPNDDSEDDEMRFIFTIRLFLTGQIGQASDGTQQLIKRASLTPAGGQGNADSDLISPLGDAAGGGGRHAPLFLRHVVGRQFKYRWLVLALTAFSCMAIIVTVSVVYSNRGR